MTPTFSAQAKLSIRSWPLIFLPSSAYSKFSRNSIIAGSVSKSVKWLCTQRSKTRVTLKNNQFIKLTTNQELH